jgi:hypothetical protein
MLMHILLTGNGAWFAYFHYRNPTLLDLAAFLQKNVESNLWRLFFEVIRRALLDATNYQTHSLEEHIVVYFDSKTPNDLQFLDL